ncbi:MAG: hypothetical protein IIW86_02255 [Clostridia bacterium]|nr:hypothetical protein [Clostridia bacterium]
MAVVWLNQNVSAWNTPSAWYYWDEDTQSAQPYGRNPQAGDTVYLNGYNVTQNFLRATFSFDGKLSNALNPYTNRSGGAFTVVSSDNQFIFNNIEVGDTNIFSNSANNNYSFTVTAETINMQGAGVLYAKGGTGVFTLNIIGNVHRSANSYLFTNQASCVLNITGNVHSEHVLCNQSCPIIINGNLSLTNAPTQTTSNLTVNGNVTVSGTYICSGGTATINGNVQYSNYEPLKGLIRATIINVPDTFEITRTDDIDISAIFTKYTMNNRQQYPPEDEVKEGTEYVWGEKVGTYQAPPESVVLKGFVYDNGDKIGSLENQNIVGCVTPEDVRKDVPLVGMGVVGSLVVPSVDDVLEGVVFDNGSVGTLIVQGGGDRLRIADFGYYTNAQSDTYIVDLTELDKPKFAVAEERVLIEMFPDLDLDNIPEKYFDDLFVKYLKYRLIVEYYRTAGINSTFTPSEPTTEIVNYQNVRNEVWLNSANIYLKAWAKKYPESIVKPQRILL